MMVRRADAIATLPIPRLSAISARFGGLRTII